MDGASHIATGQERQGVAGVYGQGGVLRLDVLPFAGLVVLDLQRSHRLTEQECPRTEICGWSCYYDAPISSINPYQCDPEPRACRSWRFLRECTCCTSCSGDDPAEHVN